MLAALQAGWISVPVDYQDYDDEDQEIADIIADNQLQKMSRLDTGKLQALLVEMDKSLINTGITALDTVTLSMLNINRAPAPDMSLSIAPSLDDWGEESVRQSLRAEKAEALPPPPVEQPLVVVETVAKEGESWRGKENMAGGARPHTLTFDKYKLIMSDEEHQLLMDDFAVYVRDVGSSFGYVGSLVRRAAEQLKKD